jgi:hypothetical protein
MSALQRNDRHNADRAELKLTRVGHPPNRELACLRCNLFGQRWQLKDF